MKTLLEVKACYDSVDTALQSELGAAIAAANQSQVQLIEARRQTNDYAYFMLLFAQFERIAKVKFVELRDKRSASPNWQQRRLWDGELLRNEERVPFLTRLAAVLDTNTPEFKRVRRYYEDRNHVAHGGLANAIGSIDVFAKDIATIAAQLRA